MTVTSTQRDWSPIVVDRPVVDFAPRPPDASPYRPDTVVDGWSAPGLVVRVASVRGYAHRYHGIPRQDEAAVGVHRPSGAVVFAVADGVSGADCSHVGAQHACHHALEALGRALDASPGDPDWTYVVESVVWNLLDEASRRLGLADHDVARTERLFATTLVAGIAVAGADGPTATVVRVGDSGIWLLRDGTYAEVVPPKTGPGAAVVDGAVRALPRRPRTVTPVRTALPPGAVLLVGTDGFGDPLGDGSGLVGDLFRSVLASPPPPLGLAHALDFSRETFDDDRTLVAIWPDGSSPPPDGEP